MNNENKTNINWYPGHMVKAKREIKEKIKLIDIIYECVDARMPSSSKLKGMDDILEAKPRILVMTKKDLCDLEETNKWEKYYKENGYEGEAERPVRYLENPVNINTQESCMMIIQTVRL